MKYPHIIKSNFGFIITMILLGTLYLNADARTYLMRGLMKTGLYKANIETQRAEGMTNNTWKVPAGVTLRDARGKEIQLADQRGKLLFINFWTTWCPPCRAEMPSINKLHSKLKDNKNILFIMIDADGKPLSAQKFMKRKKFDLPVYTAASSIPVEMFDGNLPTTLVVSPQGKIVFHHTGLADYNHPDFLQFMQSFDIR